MAQQISTNTFGCAKWVVSADATQGTHTTIAGALTSASSGDTIFIRPGTYTENITLKAGVNLTAYNCDSITPNVVILGKATFTAAGTVVASGIQFKTNSDFAIAVTGSAASILYLNSCTVNCNNNTGISFTSSSSSAAINISYSTTNLATTGIALYSSSSAGIIAFLHCTLNNTGGSSTASSHSAGVALFYFCACGIVFSTSGSGTGGFAHCVVDTSSVNTTCITTAGTGGFTNSNSLFNGGTQPAVSAGSGTTIVQEGGNLISTNTNVATGVGTIAYSDFGQGPTTGAINTTTKTLYQTNIGSLALGTPLTVANGGTGNSSATAYSLICGGTTSTGAFQGVADVATGQVLVSGGTGALPAFSATPTVTSITFGSGTALSAYAEGTWTPVIAFGGASVGVTYSTQSGWYVKIGKLCWIGFQITLSSKGSSTGTAKITGLPFTSANVGNPATFFVETTALTLSALNTDVFCSVDQNATTISVNQEGQIASSASTAANCSNTNFANNTLIFGSTVFYTA